MWSVTEFLFWNVQVAAGFEFVEGDVHWNRKAVWVDPAICALAGIAAGLLGIGGGMIKVWVRDTDMVWEYGILAESPMGTGMGSGTTDVCVSPGILFARLNR